MLAALLILGCCCMQLLSHCCLVLGAVLGGSAALLRTLSGGWPRHTPTESTTDVFVTTVHAQCCQHMLDSICWAGRGTGCST